MKELNKKLFKSYKNIFYNFLTYMAYGTRIDNYDITTKLKNQERIF